MNHRNIWDDPDDAGIVRSLADGDETVPSVIVGPVGMVNPSMTLIEEVVARHAPHLLPADEESSS